jgi:hypothetical protein
VIELSSLSKEYVRVSVHAKENGVVVNPTTDVVQMAFTAGIDPVGGDWKTASWETDATSEPDTYYARCLVGPGGTVTLAAGRYTVWLKLTDATEIPVRKIGQLVVT